VLPWREYERVRKERIRKIVEVKRRRLELGERLTPCSSRTGTRCSIRSRRWSTWIGWRNPSRSRGR